MRLRSCLTVLSVGVSLLALSATGAQADWITYHADGALSGVDQISGTAPAAPPWLMSLGADETVDYTSVRFEEVVQDVDVVIDLVGDATTALAPARWRRCVPARALKLYVSRSWRWR